MAEAKNRLIESLPRKDRVALLDVCKHVELGLANVLADPDKPMPHAYFPTEGFISLVTRIEGSPGVEVGMIGAEGMLGAHFVLGVSTSPLHALVQGGGFAWQVSASALQRVLRNSAALRRALGRYVYVLMEQLAHSASCLRFHQIGPRLARWLLMCQDRSHSDSFRVTHEFLAYMLGVRRVGVTTAAGKLQKVGLVAYQRGEIVVLDRSGLEAAACGCYAADRHTYAAWLR
ncbi:MAG: Crp/Fnr family transcriptional regulator [Pseudomonadota bacterium]|nr:Crp/Fnr family transcriptional regulator [Pseudomonadota bacterium]